MLSDDTQKRIQAVKERIDNVVEVMGVPHELAAAMIVVDVVEQHALKENEQRSIWKKVLAYTLGLMKSDV